MSKETAHERSLSSPVGTVIKTLDLETWDQVDRAGGAHLRQHANLVQPDPQDQAPGLPRLRSHHTLYETKP